MWRRTRGSELTRDYGLISRSEKVLLHDGHLTAPEHNKLRNKFESNERVQDTRTEKYTAYSGFLWSTLCVAQTPSQVSTQAVVSTDTTFPLPFNWHDSHHENHRGWKQATDPGLGWQRMHSLFSFTNKRFRKSKKSKISREYRVCMPMAMTFTCASMQLQ